MPNGPIEKTERYEEALYPDNQPETLAEDKEDYGEVLVVGADYKSPNEIANDGFSPAVLTAPIPEPELGKPQVVYQEERKIIRVNDGVGSGVQTKVIAEVRPGYEWIIDSICLSAFSGPPLSGSIGAFRTEDFIRLFVDDETRPDNLVWERYWKDVGPAAGFAMDSVCGNMPLWIPSGSLLVMQRNLQSNLTIAGRIQLRERKVDY